MFGIDSQQKQGVVIFTPAKADVDLIVQRLYEAFVDRNSFKLQSCLETLRGYFRGEVYNISNDNMQFYPWNGWFERAELEMKTRNGVTPNEEK